MSKPKNYRSRLGIEAMESRIVLTASPLAAPVAAAPAAIVVSATDATFDSNVEQLSLTKDADFNSDGRINADDIDMLALAIRSELREDNTAIFDLNGDAEVNRLDMDVMIYDQLETRYGDTDLDQDIDNIDFAIWIHSAFQRGGWANGDFNGDAIVDGHDFLIWNAARNAVAQELAAPTVDESSQLESTDMDEVEQTTDEAPRATKSETPHEPIGIQQKATSQEAFKTSSSARSKDVDEDAEKRERREKLQVVDSLFGSSLR